MRNDAINRQPLTTLPPMPPMLVSQRSAENHRQGTEWAPRAKTIELVNKDTKEAMEINVGSNQWSGMKKKSESIARAKGPIYLQAHVSSRPNTTTCRYWSTLNYMYPYHGVHP